MADAELITERASRSLVLTSNALARPDPGDSVHTATAANWATAISDTPATA